MKMMNKLPQIPVADKSRASAGWEIELVNLMRNLKDTAQLQQLSQVEHLVDDSNDNAKTIETVCEYLERLSLQRSAPITSTRLIQKARLALASGFSGHANIIFCGSTGGGKSAIVGYLVGSKLRCFSTPKPSSIGTILGLERYFPPKYPHLAVWDSPGCGAVSQPLFHDTNPNLDYYVKHCVYAFDMVVIVTGGRITEADCSLIKKCYEGQQQVVIVRNKVDQMPEEMVMNREASDIDTAKQQLRSVFEQQLKSVIGDLANKIPHFLVSMKDASQGLLNYDESLFFDELERTGKEQLMQRN